MKSRKRLTNLLCASGLALCLASCSNSSTPKRESTKSSVPTQQKPSTDSGKTTDEQATTPKQQGTTEQDPLKQLGARFLTAIQNDDFEKYHRVWRGIREAYALPVPEMRRVCVQLEVAAESCGEIRRPQARDLLELGLKFQTLLACLRAAVMVHLYRAEHEGAWPEDLASVGQIPLDPWDGQPLRYKPPEEHRPPVVYSVGANLLDDGGRADGPMGFQADRGYHDFVLPLGPWPEEDEDGPERSRK